MSDNSIMVLASEFNYPIIEETTHVWFFRTQSGTYYPDFYINQYIALGWNLVSVSLITDKKENQAAKKSKISELYPEEQRPGLILGQMETFYLKMQPNDLVVIPDMGGQRIAVGILGDVVTTIKRKPQDDESKYEICEYVHKRSVKWLKEIEAWSDVYLFKTLRAQQTISDITSYADMVYRNLHPCYIANDGLHLTLQKRTISEYRIKDNIKLQYSILQINSTLSEYYKAQDDSDKIVIKTAVGSPGFIEIILPHVPTSVLTAVFVFRSILGKVTSKDGETSTGIMALLTKGNELLNDRSNRKKIAAEINQIEANTKKTLAEVAYTDALTRKTTAEAVSIELENKKAFEELSEHTTSLKEAASQSGIILGKQLDNAS